MSTAIEVSPEIKNWVVSELLKTSNHRNGYRHAERIDELPESYGSYSVFDGIHLQGAGMRRNVREAFHEFAARRFQMFIFLWRPDTDGSVAKWLDHSFADDEDQEEERECWHCDGAGVAQA
jgi:hypothetical protein